MMMSPHSFNVGTPATGREVKRILFPCVLPLFFLMANTMVTDAVCCAAAFGAPTC